MCHNRKVFDCFHKIINSIPRYQNKRNKYFADTESLATFALVNLVAKITKT